ncbi:MAG: hypothetical protein JWM99_236 [Verrucomicrobiales bacterium]|jgi:alpha/beta superfamily hydrolase|nr:hypothetical protein [Verrucomicrobiales bacterium]
MFGEMRNKQGERLDYTFHAGKPDSKRIVVIGHGVTGNKDRPFVVALAEALAKAGISALRFSFSGNGASEGRFADSTISKEVEDLGSVIDVLKGNEICYVGHSMGGAVGVIQASRDSRIRYLVSLAGMVHTKAFADREFGTVKPGAGFMWDDSNCPLSEAYMEDMERIGTIVELGPKIQVPWLLVHGTEDDVVPLQDSLDIFERAKEPKTLHQIKGSNHVFSGEFAAPMIQTVEAWVKRNCA